MSGAVGVIGTLVGVLLGAFGAYLSQRSNLRMQSNEKINETRRICYSAWLTEVHRIEFALRRSSLDVITGKLTQVDSNEKLSKLSWIEAQGALEELRMVAGVDTARMATRLWRHMDKNPRHDPTSDLYTEWRSQYWHLRREFINSARNEFSVIPLDFDN